MVHTLPSVLTEQDEDIREVNPVNAVLLRRLGLEALPAHETLILPTARLIVSGADQLVRSAKRLVKSIQHVGILQNPSVVLQGGVDIHDAEATFEVIAGRRRVLAARLAGLAVVKCEVYAESTMQLSALLALIENEQRSAAWVREVEALRCLIDEGVGMTLDDLAAFGFDRATLTERLKIAQLPTSLLDRILSGNVSREVARKLVRLTQAQQERVASLAMAGEEITAECVKDILRAQINTGLVPVQDALAQGWNTTSSHVSVVPDTLVPDTSPFLAQQRREELVEQSGCLDKDCMPEACQADSIPSLSSLLAVLQAFEHCPDYRTVPQAVQTLSQALMQQLRVALRDAPLASQSQPTVNLNQNEKEYETMFAFDQDFRKADPVSRGCGDREPGGIYAECGLSSRGRPLEEFLIDPPLPIPPGLDLVNKPQTWQRLLPTGEPALDGEGLPIFDLLIWVGQEHYPYVTDYLEETRRFGASRRLNPNLDLSLLSRSSRMILAHPRVINTAWQEQRPPQSCKKEVPGHDAAIAASDDEVGDASNETGEESINRPLQHLIGTSSVSLLPVLSPASPRTGPCLFKLWELIPQEAAQTAIDILDSEVGELPPGAELLPLCLREIGSTIYQYRPTGESADGLVPGIFAVLPITGFALVRFQDGSVNERAKEKILAGLEAHGSHAIPVYETDR